MSNAESKRGCTNPASPAVTLRRYVFRDPGNWNWAIIVLGSDGYFSSVSDFGNYAFLWTHHGCADFREFLIRADVDYLTKKLQPGGDGPGDVYDGRATLQHVKETILRLRREGSLTREDAREEWDLLDEFNLEWEGDFGEWYRNTRLSDAYEYAIHRRNPQAQAFVERVVKGWLCGVIAAELEAERSAA